MNDKVILGTGWEDDGIMFSKTIPCLDWSPKYMAPLCCFFMTSYIHLSGLGMLVTTWQLILWQTKCQRWAIYKFLPVRHLSFVSGLGTHLSLSVRHYFKMNQTIIVSRSIHHVTLTEFPSWLLSVNLTGPPVRLSSVSQSTELLSILEQCFSNFYEPRHTSFI